MYNMKPYVEAYFKVVTSYDNAANVLGMMIRVTLGNNTNELVLSSLLYVRVVISSVGLPT